MYTLKKFREAVPGTEGMSDYELADLYSQAANISPELARRDFGLSQRNDGLGGDVVTSVKRGIQKIPGMITGLADLAPALATGARPFSSAADYWGEKTGFRPGKWADDASGEYSAKHQAAQKEIDKVWDNPATDGFDVAGAYASNPSYLLNQGVESLPSMAVGGIGSRVILGLGGKAAGGVTTGALERAIGSRAVPAAAAIGEGAVTTGQQMDQFKGEDQQRNAGYSLLAGLGTGAVGYGLGRLANKAGFETLETAMAGGRRIEGGVPADLLMHARPGGFAVESAKRVGKGGAVEATQEFLQSGQEQGWQNLAEDKPYDQGMLRQAVEGAAVGFGLGGGANVFASKGDTRTSQREYDAASAQRWKNTRDSLEGKGRPDDPGSYQPQLQGLGVPAQTEPTAPAAALTDPTEPAGDAGGINETSMLDALDKSDAAEAAPMAPTVDPAVQREELLARRLEMHDHLVNEMGFPEDVARAKTMEAIPDPRTDPNSPAAVTLGFTDKEKRYIDLIDPAMKPEKAVGLVNKLRTEAAALQAEQQKEEAKQAAFDRARETLNATLAAISGAPSVAPQIAALKAAAEASVQNPLLIADALKEAAALQKQVVREQAAAQKVGLKKKESASVPETAKTPVPVLPEKAQSVKAVPAAPVEKRAITPVTPAPKPLINPGVVPRTPAKRAPVAPATTPQGDTNGNVREVVRPGADQSQQAQAVRSRIAQGRQAQTGQGIRLPAVQTENAPAEVAPAVVAVVESLSRHANLPREQGAAVKGHLDWTPEELKSVAAEMDQKQRKEPNGVYARLFSTLKEWDAAHAAFANAHSSGKQAEHMARARAARTGSEDAIVPLFKEMAAQWGTKNVDRLIAHLKTRNEQAGVTEQGPHVRLAAAWNAFKHGKLTTGETGGDVLRGNKLEEAIDKQLRSQGVLVPSHFQSLLEKDGLMSFLSERRWQGFDPDVKATAALVYDFFKKLGDPPTVRQAKEGELPKNALGEYRAKPNEVLLNSSGEDMVTLLHELLHAITQKQLKNENSVARAELQRTLAAFAKKHDTAYTAFAKTLSATERAELDVALKNTVEALKNAADSKIKLNTALAEFVTYGFTNRPFQSYMKALDIGAIKSPFQLNQVPNKKGVIPSNAPLTVWSRFVNAISWLVTGKAYDGKSSKVFDHFLSNSGKLLQEIAVTPEAVKEAATLKAAADAKHKAAVSGTAEERASTIAAHTKALKDYKASTNERLFSEAPEVQTEDGQWVSPEVWGEQTFGPAFAEYTQAFQSKLSSMRDTIAALPGHANVEPVTLRYDHNTPSQGMSINPLVFDAMQVTEEGAAESEAAAVVSTLLHESTGDVQALIRQLNRAHPGVLSRWVNDVRVLLEKHHDIPTEFNDIPAERRRAAGDNNASTEQKDASAPSPEGLGNESPGERPGSTGLGDNVRREGSQPARSTGESESGAVDPEAPTGEERLFSEAPALPANGEPVDVAKLVRFDPAHLRSSWFQDFAERVGYAGWARKVGESAESNAQKFAKAFPAAASYVQYIDHAFGLPTVLSEAWKKTEAQSHFASGRANELAAMMNNMPEGEQQKVLDFLDGKKVADMQPTTKFLAEQFKVAYDELEADYLAKAALPDNKRAALETRVKGATFTDKLLYIADSSKTSGRSMSVTPITAWMAGKNASIEKTLVNGIDEGLTGKFYARLEKGNGTLAGFTHESMAHIAPADSETIDLSTGWFFKGADKLNKDNIIMDRAVNYKDAKKLNKAATHASAIQNTVAHMDRVVSSARFAESTATFGKQHGLVYDSREELEKEHPHVKGARIYTIGEARSASRAEQNALRRTDRWIAVPETAAAYGDMAGKLINGSVWGALEDIHHNQPAINSPAYNTVLSWFKANKTVLSPGTHMVNAGSNVAWLYMHDIPVSALADSTKMYWKAKTDPTSMTPKERALWDSFERSGALIADYSSAEIRNLLSTSAVESMGSKPLPSVWGLTEAMVKYEKAKAHAVAQYALKKGRQGFDVAQELYAAEDNVFRFAAFLSKAATMESANGGVPLTNEALLEAGRAASTEFLDYNIHARGVNFMKQTFMPFVSWPYRAVPAMLKIALYKPWKLAGIISAMALIDALSVAMSGGSDEDERKRKVLPGYMNDRLFGFGPRMYIQTGGSYDKPTYFKVGSFIPLGDLVQDDARNGFLGQKWFPQQFTPNGPIVSALAASIFNVDPFTGAKINKDTDTQWDAFKKRAMFLTGQIVPPALDPKRGVERWDRIVNDKTGPLGHEYSKSMELMQLVGFRFSQVDIPEAAASQKRAASAVDMEYKKELARVVRESLRYPNRNPEDLAKQKEKLNAQKTAELARIRNLPVN